MSRDDPRPAETDPGDQPDLDGQPRARLRSGDAQTPAEVAKRPAKATPKGSFAAMEDFRALPVAQLLEVVQTQRLALFGGELVYRRAQLLGGQPLDRDLLARRRGDAASRQDRVDCGPVCLASLAANLALAALALAWLLIAPQAFAAGNDVARNIGSTLRGAAGQIYGGAVAVIGLLFLFNRRFTDLAMFFLAAILVGWLVFSPDGVADTARALAKQVLP